MAWPPLLLIPGASCHFPRFCGSSIFSSWDFCEIIQGGAVATPGWNPGRPAPLLPSCYYFFWGRASGWSLAFCLWSLGLESSRPLTAFFSQGHPSSHETAACFLPGACNPLGPPSPGAQFGICVLHWMLACESVAAGSGASVRMGLWGPEPPLPLAKGYVP